VSKVSWSAPTDPQTVARRAGGRRHYNAMRQLKVLFRRKQLVELAGQVGGLWKHGARAELARLLGVHPSVISRDIRALTAGAVRVCPFCGTFTPAEMVQMALEAIGLAPSFLDLDPSHEENPAHAK
jgi:hypothetical protein